VPEAVSPWAACLCRSLRSFTKITICQNCESTNWDGIFPRSHPRLLEHMKANGIEVRLNKKRCIDIPPTGSPAN
jgi:hypothetical protein